jgi:hypothetical protein
MMRKTKKLKKAGIALLAVGAVACALAKKCDDNREDTIASRMVMHEKNRTMHNAWQSEALHPAREKRTPSIDSRLNSSNTLLEKISVDYNERNLSCRPTKDYRNANVSEYARYFYHTSPAVSNPASINLTGETGTAYQPPIQTYHDLENARREELFSILDYMAGLGLTVDSGIRRRPRMHRMLETDGIHGEFYSDDCLQINGEAYLVASRTVEIIHDRMLANEIHPESALENIPPEFHSIFHDKLAESLFAHETTFSADEATRILDSFSDEDIHNFMMHLSRWTAMNDTCMDNAMLLLDTLNPDGRVGRQLHEIIEQSGIVRSTIGDFIEGDNQQ